MTDRYAVVGHPVAHSVSPQIHAEFARQTGQELEYARLLAPRDGFRAALAKFRDAGGKGINVTVPFKLEAWDFVAARAGHAHDAGAVNTIDFRNGTSVGYNTDGIGLIRDLEQNLGFAIAGKRVLLMGAGGAAQGVLAPLIEQAPALLVIANRTEAKAEHLLQAYFARKGPLSTLNWRSYPELAHETFDLVINATSASLAGELPPLPAGLFAPDSLAYDMMYGRDSTPFMKFAHKHGAARVADGVGMLVEQAAESFFVWRNVRPQTAPVIALLKREG